MQRPEVCNAIDDDCDGPVDEDASRGACEVGEGACALPGQWVCRDGVERCEGEGGVTGEEICNTRDDDCDGQIDEALDGEPCVAGLGACAVAGQWVCEAGVLECRGPVGPPVQEICNGQDDDCDGPIDEGAVGEPCEVGLGACAEPGREVCRGGRLICEGQAGPARGETCNGVDDDCDGRLDEEVQTPPCERGVGACRAVGILACQNAQMICDAMPLAPAAENCNRHDDDCDGATDEALGGSPCIAGIGACAVEGQQVCSEGALVCSATPGRPEAETCNGADDDCDGTADEDIGGARCVRGVGACEAAGRLVCSNGALACDAPMDAGGPEACNGIDDDCDGRVDESLIGPCVICVPRPGEWDRDCWDFGRFQ